MTPPQMQALDFVRDRISELGYAPTVREIADQCRLTVSGAHKVLDVLVAAGYLRRVPAKRRGLELPGEIDLRGTGSSAMLAELARRGMTLDSLPTDRPIAYGTRRSCAADTCGAEVTRGQLMCRNHWFTLPRALRDDILQTHARALKTRDRREADRFQMLVTQARDIADGLGAGR